MLDDTSLFSIAMNNVLLMNAVMSLFLFCRRFFCSNLAVVFFSFTYSNVLFCLYLALEKRKFLRKKNKDIVFLDHGY